VPCPPGIGGQPITYQQPGYVRPSGGYYAAPTSAPPRQPYSGGQALAPAGQPKVRFQKSDEPPASERRPEPATATLTLPPPEELAGNGQPPAADVDLNALYSRLDELGAQSTESSRTPEGYRFVCKLATADRSRSERIEVRGATRIEAARSLLARAEQWAQAK
jgi:hypothetical protein